MSATLAAGSARAAQITTPHSLFELSAAEVTAARTAAQADTRVVSMLGSGPALAQVSGVQLIKADTVPYLSGQTARLPFRFVTVLLFNPRATTAASVTVQLGINRVVSVEAVTLDELPVFREEAEQAVALARADASVRAAVGGSIDNYRLRVPDIGGPMPYAAEIMPLYTSSVRDLCYAGRCVEVHFRSPTGYLPLRVQVNLAARTVSLIRRDPRQGSHGGMHQ